ncbi:MAG: ABC transporter substrate-binding protein [Gammaproteobacteria bacterium]|nr:MAG: ABC transporter substrate-binding protein [Gammaproteobacteria bacterium]
MIKKAVCMALILLAVIGKVNAGDIQVIGEEMYPAQYTDESGQVTGITAELVKELLRRLDLKDEIKLFPWKRAYRMALQGPDIALFEMTRTAEREEFFKWVGPINRADWGLYALASSKIVINRLEDAKQAGQICGYRGDARAEYLVKKGFSNITNVEVGRPIQCARMLEKGRLDLWIASEMGLSELLKTENKARSDYKLVFPIDVKYLFIAFSKHTSDDVIDLWQKELDKMKKDGTMMKFYQGKYPDEVIMDLISK